MYGGINTNRLGPVHPSLKDALRFGACFDWPPGRSPRITKAGLSSPLLFNKSTPGKNHLFLNPGGFFTSQAARKAKQAKKDISTLISFTKNREARIIQVERREVFACFKFGFKAKSFTQKESKKWP